MIPFNKPYLTGNETKYISQAVASGKISGNGDFTKKCQKFFQDRYGFKKCLLTTSCTDALEMCALLLNIAPGDEVIVPSYTFVSSALAFNREGATLVFADSCEQNPNLDVSQLEGLITLRTKAIVVVHYAGIACDMEAIMYLANKHNIYVIEDAAQAIDSFHNGKPLGGIGHFAAFSFHETKNIIAGEGGMLVINDERFIARSEIIWEKGTNRAAFFRGEIDKYGWVDTGSSFLPSEVTAAFLYAQLENLDSIQKKRKEIWQRYFNGLIHLEKLDLIKLPNFPGYATNNAHMFYIITKDYKERTALIRAINLAGAHAVFHYISLHSSHYYTESNELQNLPKSIYYTNCLVRLPFFYELENLDQQLVIDAILAYYN